MTAVNRFVVEARIDSDFKLRGVATIVNFNASCYYDSTITVSSNTNTKLAVAQSNGISCADKCTSFP